MPLPRLRTSLRAQLVATGAGAVAVTAALLTAVGGWQVTGLASQAGDDVDRLMRDSMSQTTQQAVTMVGTQVATVTDRMASSLRVAQETFAQAGALTFEGSEHWTVTDQTTGATEEVDLPRLQVGGTWLGRTTDPAVPVPVVDDITSLLDAPVTVFQRVDAEGDMLRVATSVTNADGARVIGTAIGATGADGTPNAVVASLLAGQPYYGTATVVGQPYVTAYAPLMAGDDVVGALFVGVPQTEVDAPLRAALAEVAVGEEGYLTVADADGKWVVPPPGAQAGDAAGSVDADGEAYAPRLVEAAAALGEGRRRPSAWTSGRPAPPPCSSPGTRRGAGPSPRGASTPTCARCPPSWSPARAPSCSRCWWPGSWWPRRRSRSSCGSRAGSSRGSAGSPPRCGGSRTGTCPWRCAARAATRSA
ncbi:Cache 3/Cache 2 fusion domain-containing protein [Cellulosimicrobium cellulans]|uniref:Cache 3/Cache 2 fusion domain-containing protein n=1 Tax=Cellulosimicrobium cellulans TaxID=1710 RepID=UPI00130D4E3A|nr:Cache 3/Cache 2 fusion domain-containing protein [Cellulosimicrobium cellulans]